MNLAPLPRFLPYLNVYLRRYCPQSLNDWRRAGEKLGCNINDTKNLRRKYHCVPNERRTELLEFCYEPPRILAHTGNCLELADSGTLNHVKCKGKFTSGCPDSPYYSDEIFKHPSCLHINSENSCFSADKICFTEKRDVSSPTGSEIERTIGLIAGGFAIALLALIIVCLVKRFLKVRKPDGRPNNRNPEKKKTPEKQREEHFSFIEGIPRNHDVRNTSHNNSLSVYPTQNGLSHDEGTLYKKTHRRQTSDQQSDEKIVVAIDIGSTYSGFAFSTQRNFNMDPFRITVHSWIGYKGTKTDVKTSTSVLFNEELKVVKFGFEAESEYQLKAESNLHTNYYCFQHFKNQIPRSLKEKGERPVIEDVMGRQLSTLLVVTSVIRYLKEAALKEIKTYYDENIDIRWVISVPEGWDTQEKFFLHYAAIDAGIESDKLLTTEETKAVNWYCKYLPMNILLSGQQIVPVLDPQTRYLVLDAGGKSVELTLNEIQIDGDIKEIVHRNCSYGGETVNKAFQEVLENVIGKKVLDKYVSENGTDFTELQMNFENRKRVAESDMAGFVNIRVPLSLDDFYTSENSENPQTIAETISHSKYNGRLEWHRDKIRIHNELFLSLFKTPCSEIIDMIREVLKEKEFEKGTETIIMVGGFSESEVLKSKIRQSFASFHIFVPNDARLAVLKGSVLLGHQSHSFVFSGLVHSKNRSI